MIDIERLLQLAARCRRMAGGCQTLAIARKFEALALDYEDYARCLRQAGEMATETPPDHRPVAGGRPLRTVRACA